MNVWDLVMELQCVTFIIFNLPPPVVLNSLISYIKSISSLPVMSRLHAISEWLTNSFPWLATGIRLSRSSIENPHIRTWCDKNVILIMENKIWRFQKIKPFYPSFHMIASLPRSYTHCSPGDVVGISSMYISWRSWTWRSLYSVFKTHRPGRNIRWSRSL